MFATGINMWVLFFLGIQQSEVVKSADFEA
jgi:hypothetical protein